MPDFLSMALELEAYTRGLRRDFHRYPELGFQEVRTASIVSRELTGLGLEVHSGVAETGVVGLLEGNRPGPVVLLRFDMDALPIQEETGAEYASSHPGVMHACGHDGHTAVGLTVARMLQQYRDQLPGTVKLVFQPAEEGLGGAKRMIQEGVLENPRPDYALALHLWNTRPLGWLGVADGPVMAASEFFQVRIIGDGGHAAAPHLTIDPILAAAQTVIALQSIVARNIAALKSAVVTVSRFHGGETYNVIPAEVVLHGTIRAFDPEIRQRVLTRFEQVVHGVVEAMEGRAEVEVVEGTPAVVNEAHIAARVREVASQVLPGFEVDTQDRTMGSEDMAYMMQTVPGCYFFVGSANPEAGLDFGHHHPRFDFDEAALPRAAALMAAAALELLGA